MDEDLISTIPRELNLPPGQNYAGLKAEGIDLVQQLSGEIWTDYNTHDPGVTILEQLCYALTELSYKSTLDIEDLLCAKSAEPLNYQDNAFLPAQDIFPTRPLTLLDYRRLLIDRLYPHLQNAWLVPLEKSSHGINMSGLYSVQLLAKEASGVPHEAIREAAIKVLNLNRNLCEDFDTVTVLTPLRLSVKADIDLHPDAIGETVLSEVMFRLATAITPHVRFQSLEELLEDEQMSPDEAFNGPVPQHGFVNIEDLNTSGIQTLRNCPQIANLEQVIRGIKGVEDVRSLDIGLFLPSGDAPAQYQVIKRFHKNDTLFSLIPDSEELRMGQLLLEDNEKAPGGFISVEEDKEIPPGYCPVLDFESIMDNELVTFYVDELPYELIPISRVKI